MKLVFLLVAFLFISEASCSVIDQDPPKECKINSQDPSKVFYTISVSKSGRGNFTTIQEAVNFIPTDNDKWVKIFLSPGTYKEKVQIMQKQCIVMEGHDSSTTMITFDDHDNTAQSITFDAYTHNFVARRITFQNSYNLPGGSSQITPAVAVRTYGQKHAYYDCVFEGYQDTLWDDGGRHYYKSCTIKGAVDFIWGGGAAIFEGCEIEVTGEGFITAQGKNSSSQQSGFVFKNCKVSGQSQTLLGRAYHAFACVLFIDSNLAGIIRPEGWSIWEQSGHEKDITFAEVDCKGPGSDGSKRVAWMKHLSSSAVAMYDKQAFIDQDRWLEKLP